MTDSKKIIFSTLVLAGLSGAIYGVLQSKKKSNLSSSIPTSPPLSI